MIQHPINRKISPLLIPRMNKVLDEADFQIKEEPYQFIAKPSLDPEPPPLNIES